MSSTPRKLTLEQLRKRHSVKKQTEQAIAMMMLKKPKAVPVEVKEIVPEGEQVVPAE